MKAATKHTIIFFLLLIGSAGLCFSSAPADDSEPEASVETDASVNGRVTVYYFHDNFRCKTCRAMEELAEKAVREGFSDEMEQGRVVWRVINTDESEHAHFKKDYQLITKSLIVVRENKDEKPQWKNCPKIWELVWKQDAFKKYVIEQVQAFLVEK